MSADNNLESGPTLTSRTRDFLRDNLRDETWLLVEWLFESQLTDAMAEIETLKKASGAPELQGEIDRLKDQLRRMAESHAAAVASAKEATDKLDAQFGINDTLDKRCIQLEVENAELKSKLAAAPAEAVAPAEDAVVTVDDPFVVFTEKNRASIVRYYLAGKPVKQIMSCLGRNFRTAGMPALIREYLRSLGHEVPDPPTHDERARMGHEAAMAKGYGIPKDRPVETLEQKVARLHGEGKPVGKIAQSVKKRSQDVEAILVQLGLAGPPEPVKKRERPTDQTGGAGSSRKSSPHAEAVVALALDQLGEASIRQLQTKVPLTDQAIGRALQNLRVAGKAILVQPYVPGKQGAIWGPVVPQADAAALSTDLPVNSDHVDDVDTIAEHVDDSANDVHEISEPDAGVEETRIPPEPRPENPPADEESIGDGKAAAVVGEAPAGDLAPPAITHPGNSKSLERQSSDEIPIDLLAKMLRKFDDGATLQSVVGTAGYYGFILKLPDVIQLLREHGREVPEGATLDYCKQPENARGFVTVEGITSQVAITHPRHFDAHKTVQAIMLIADGEDEQAMVEFRIDREGVAWLDNAHQAWIKDYRRCKSRGERQQMRGNWLTELLKQGRKAG